MPRYEDYANLIMNEAWRRTKLNPTLEFEELVSQGNLAFCLALKSWDEAKGAFSTHLWWQIRDQMGKCPTYIGAELDESNEPVDMSSPESALAFLAAVNDIGAEAREVCFLIFNSPEELCDFTAASIRVTQTNIGRYLRSMRWPRKKINRAINEIKNMLAAII